MAAAAEVVRDLGGLESARVFTRMWLSLLGLWSWERVPVLPPEQMLLPARAPLSIYSFGCWARQTIVALQIATALRPVRPVAFAVDELRTGIEPPPPQLDAWGRSLTLLDKGLRQYQRRPVRALRQRALRAAERWVVERQEADGSWGGIQPPWVWSIIALHALGYPLDHPVLDKALTGLDTFTIEDELGRRIEACQSPVWDTALAVIGLLDAGLDPSHPAVAGAASWLAERQVKVHGDWSLRRPHVEPGGFPFEFANDNYPDVDDTAEIVLALRRSEAGAAEAAARRALDARHAVGQRRLGRVRRRQHEPARRQAPVLRLRRGHRPAERRRHRARAGGARAARSSCTTGASQRGISYLLREQERDGSWFGRWGANHLYGTGAAVPALAACGLAEHESVERAVAWLESVQNEDGGFGEDLRSYKDAAWRGRGESTASQTAWALLALDAAGAEGDVVDRAVGWLLAHAARGRRLGRGLVHGNRLSGRLLPQLSFV